MKTATGVEVKPCPEHGEEHLGMFTGVCLACMNAAWERLYPCWLDEIAKASRARTHKTS